MTEQQQGGQAPASSTSAPPHSQPGQDRADNSKEVLAASKFSQQLIEQKERELHESIAINYTRIRDVERELRGLQMQVKLTAEPKKHALELLRKKIELQNIRVQAVKSRYVVAKQAYEQLQTELEHEESAKQQLCDELNQLVTTSVSCQLESFEQLKVKLEALHGGAAGAMGRTSSAPVQCTTAGAAAGPAGQGARQQPSEVGAGTGPVQAVQQQQQQQLREGLPPQLPVSTAAMAPEDVGQDAAAAAKAAAEAARARHVQLPGRSRHKTAGTAGTGAAMAAAARRTGSSAGSGQECRPSTTDQDGKFAGFDA